MVINIALICLVAATVLTVIRLFAGPNWGDRVTAYDFLSVNFALLIVVFAIKTGFVAFLDIALLVSIVGFLSTIALTRHLLDGKVL
ncbi:MAG: monovalent cation/H+ antiporter complex subunit F [Deinococcota bacterium]